MCIYDVYGPCSCPHGRCFTVLAQCFTISSWICSLTAITSCFYVYVRPIPEEGQPELPREGFGYISRQVGVLEPPSYRQCVFYEKDEKEMFFDGMWRAGKAMSLLACGIGGIVMAIVMCTCCVAFQLRTFEGLFWTCMFCFLAQALTFLSWGSNLCDEYECTWSSGTGMNITAAMLWVWAANMIKSFPEALPPRGRGRSKRPVYDENDDYDPYAAGGFDDEYDYDGEEGDFENDGEYYDDYDNSYYDDPSQDFYEDQTQDDDNQTYPEEERGHLANDEYNDPYGNDPYQTDYQEPEPQSGRRYKQGRDDEFEPNSHFEGSWTGDDDESRFSESGADSNAFRESSSELNSSQSQLSQEELKFLGGDNDNNSSFRGID